MIPSSKLSKHHIPLQAIRSVQIMWRQGSSSKWNLFKSLVCSLTEPNETYNSLLYIVPYNNLHSGCHDSLVKALDRWNANGYLLLCSAHLMLPHLNFEINNTFHMEINFQRQFQWTSREGFLYPVSFPLLHFHNNFLLIKMSVN